ncbi:(6-4)-photolyase [Arctopsyche grandis]|uniref:(6-4)-photolyase n=1 Tax=Arctopsyche grandis TaxID=121162 RepID=UPI00406D6742
MTTRTAVHWFRKGLRLHDNPALLEAIKHAEENKCFFRAIFIIDPNIIKFMKVGSNRWRFLAQSLVQLNENLIAINSRLYVVRGSPYTVFPDLFKLWNVSVLTFEVDTEPYSVTRDERVEKLAEKAGVKVIQKVSHTLYNVHTVVRMNGGSPPLTYQKFLSVIQLLSNPRQPLKAPDKLNDYTKPHIDSNELASKFCYDCPTIEDFGVEVTELGPCLFPGGETEALQRLDATLVRKQWICKFEKPNTSPNSLEPSTTVLSPYLKFGCLSPNLFYYKLKGIIDNNVHTKPPVSLIGQLLWREFYYVVAAMTPNFNKMEGNSICCQIPWVNNLTYLSAWKEGRTGYPFIDAIMRQLKQEGWIHHLARHAVACFLTRGDLWVSWELGQEVFEEYLLDADWALNAGNWLWLSASAFFHQFFRVYSPVAFGKKTDKNGLYIKKYVPELVRFPPEYIYEPWKAPVSFQKSVNCIIGKDYPNRIVVHEDVYKENIAKMSLAYKNKRAVHEVSLKRPSTSELHAKNKKAK